MNALGGEETMTQKRIEFFKQLVPNLTRLGMIAPGAGYLAMKEKDALRKVATQLGFELMLYGIATLDDLEGAFAAGLRDGVSAFYISGEPLLFTNMSRVVLLSPPRESPCRSISEWGRGGLLMSYSTDPLDSLCHAGIYVAKILNGASPACSAIEGKRGRGGSQGGQTD